jgi:hypothetical protein
LKPGATAKTCPRQSSRSGHEHLSVSTVERPRCPLSLLHGHSTETHQERRADHRRQHD